MIVCDDVEYRGTAMDYSEETQELIMNFVFLEGGRREQYYSSRSELQSGGDVDYAAQPPQLSRLGRGICEASGGREAEGPAEAIFFSNLSMRPCSVLFSLCI